MASSSGLSSNPSNLSLTIDGLTTVYSNGSVIDPTLYVPYTGATTNLDLGSNTLSTTGTISGTTISGTNINGTTIIGSDFIGNTLSIKNSGNVNNYLLDYDEKTNNLDFRYVTGSTNDKIFSLDQYGNMFLPQGLYFTGAVDHYIGNTALSNIVFSIQTAYKYSFLVNNIERAYINSDGFNTTNKIYLNDSATANRWSLHTATDLKFIIAYNDGQIAYFSSATGFNTGQINFTTSLNGVSPSTFSNIISNSALINQNNTFTGTQNFTNINTIIPTVYNVTSVGYLSGVQLIVTITGYPYIVGNVIMIQENSEYNGLFTVQTIVNSNVFYVNNPSFSNNGTQAGGKASLYSGIVSSFYNNSKMLIIDDDWIIRKRSSLGYLFFNYQGVTRASLDPTGIFSSSSINFTGNINSISATVLNYLSGATSNIQAQISGISTNFIPITGNPTGVNVGLYLSSTGAFAVYQNSLVLAFSVTNATGITYIKNLNSSSQINSVSTSYYDPTSSIQTQLDARITKTGITTGVNGILRLLNAGNFTITNSLSDPIMLIQNNTRDTYLYNLTSASQINGNSAGFYDFTSSGQTQLNNRILKAGTTTAINATLQLASLGAFAIENSSGNTTMAISAENNFYLNGVSQVRFIFSPTSILYGSFWRNDGNTTLLMLTNINDVNGSWNGLRPFYVDNGSGKIYSLNGQYFDGGLRSNQITCLELITNVDDQLIIKTGTSDSAPIGSYITLRTSASSLGVNFVNWGNTVNWGSFRSSGFDCNVPLRVNTTTINVNAPKITSYNPFVLCQTGQNSAVGISDSQVISLTANSANWSTGYTFSSIFTKYCEGSTVSIVGTVSCYTVSPNQSITFRVRFSNISTGIDYDITQVAFMNVNLNHAAIGVSGQPNSSPGVSIPAGVYDVTFTLLSATNTDGNDYIRCLVFLSPGTP